MNRGMVRLIAIACCLASTADADSSLVGIGAKLKAVDGGVEVEGVIPGGPAEEAGLPVGCVITHVDDAAIAEMPLAAVVERIRGQEETVVVLKVVHGPGLTRNYRIPRTRLELGSADTLPGRYAFEHDPSARVIIERDGPDRFRIRSEEQHWKGVGVVGNGCFKGVFRMADVPDVHENFRDAAGFVRIDFAYGDRLRFRSRFNFFDSGDRMIDRTLVRVPADTP